MVGGRTSIHQLLGDMFRMGFPTRNELGLYIDGWIICSPANEETPEIFASEDGKNPGMMIVFCFFLWQELSMPKLDLRFPSAESLKMWGNSWAWLRSEGFCRGKSFSSGLYCSSSC